MHELPGEERGSKIDGTGTNAEKAPSTSKAHYAESAVELSE